MHVNDNELKELIATVVVGALSEALKKRDAANAEGMKQLGDRVGSGVRRYVDERVARAETASYEIARSLERRVERLEKAKK